MSAVPAGTLFFVGVSNSEGGPHTPSTRYAVNPTTGASRGTIVTEADAEYEVGVAVAMSDLATGRWASDTGALNWYTPVAVHVGDEAADGWKLVGVGTSWLWAARDYNVDGQIYIEFAKFNLETGALEDVQSVANWTDEDGFFVFIMCADPAGNLYYHQGVRPGPSVLQGFNWDTGDLGVIRTFDAEPTPIESLALQDGRLLCNLFRRHIDGTEDKALQILNPATGGSADVTYFSFSGPFDDPSGIPPFQSPWTIHTDANSFWANASPNTEMVQRRAVSNGAVLVECERPIELEFTPWGWYVAQVTTPLPPSPAQLTLLNGSITMPLAPDGRPVPYGTLTFYESGTVIPKAVYHDAAGLEVWADPPVTLDQFGRAIIFLDIGGPYDILLRDRNGAEIWSLTRIEAEAMAVATPTAPAGSFFLVGYGV